jgi:hypothetical protein
MLRRAIGLVLVLVGLTGLVICYLGARAGRDFVDGIALSAEGVLETAGASLNTIEESLEQSRQSISAITATIAAVRETTANLASTVDDTQPMLDDLALLLGQDIPNTIGDVQDAIPNVVQTARVVDDTLRLLSRLQVEETIPLIDYEISFGLGVEYDPEIPLDQAVEGVGSDLGPIAETSANLQGELQTAKVNMGLLSRDLTRLTVELGRLNQEVSQFRPLLDEYGTQLNDMRDGIGQGRERLDDQLSTAKQTIVLAAVWLALSQLLPLYIGVELLIGNRMVRPVGPEAS